MPRRRLPHGPRLLALLALLAALVAAGCGGDDGASAGADPATVAPADAFLYAEVVVRPEGEVEAGASAALRKVLRTDDPGSEIVRLLDEGLSDDDGDLTYAEDVEPWLGERAGGFLLLDAAEGDPDGAVALAVTDRGALDDLIGRMRDAGDQRAAGSYRGVDYDADRGDDSYSAVVGDFYVSGTLPALRAAIDASRDGDGLAEASRFEDAQDELPDDAIASLWVDPQALADQLRSVEDVDPQVRRALGSSQLAEADPVVASVTMTADEIAFEASADAELAGDALDAGDDDAATVGELPGDAWLALATPPLGPLIRQALDSAGVLDEAAAQLRQGAGLDLDSDLLDALGGLGLFVRGTNPLAIGGGVLIRTTSDAAARRLVTMLESIAGASGLGRPRPVAAGGARGFQIAIPQSPQPIVVLAQGSEIAAGYAISSAQDLLDPQQRFEDSDDGGAAIDSLGEGYEPSFVLLAPPLTELLRSLDQLQVADLSGVLPYLGAYRSLAIGTKRDGDRQTVRAVAALR